ncbi:unnamed protein product [Euphydryas editha]|uniref:Transmembrane and coiled-coil domain-containing protein 7 n=1 Tax=Euphydryas editha TaxID=104508 RepID=A0AAU9V2Q1_EUPED|nr:unnamed protein product [Euphydryas editha]
MSNLSNIFEQLEKLIETESGSDLMRIIMKEDFNPNEICDTQEASSKYKFIKCYLQSIVNEIDALAAEIEKNDEILISVKNRKLLKTCFHLLVSLGISTCLIPGLGISLEKRCISAQSIPKVNLTDEQKYEILIICTNFLQRSYEVSALKPIIISFHLSDYLAALIQLAFAPLKKPGVYPNYTMTQTMYDKLNCERQRYIRIYEYVVNNCFQPLVMKELLVLQSVTEPPPPLFVKKLLSKEMSKRLTAPDGLGSLIRCFMESYNRDTGMEWKNMNVICKIVVAKHGHMSESDYLENIVSQLKEILSLNSLQYLTTGIACLLTLHKKYDESELVLNLVNDVFNTLNFDVLSKSNLPNTIILTTQEIEHNIKFFQACTIILKLIDLPAELISPNLHMLFLLRIKCTKDETKLKLSDIILKSLEILKVEEIENIVEKFLFGPEQSESSNILVEEYEAGLVVKCSASHTEHPKNEALTNFLEIFNALTENKLVTDLFESCLRLFVKLNSRRKLKHTTETLISVEDEPQVLSTDQNYAQMLHVLAEISASERVTTALKENPCIVIYFVESLLFDNSAELNDECSTIALVLLNTILSNINNTRTKDLDRRLHNLVPVLEKLAKNASEYTGILCNEAISLIVADCPKSEISAYENALSYTYDKLLPVRAHGIIEMTKLIDKADPETISKRHYLFCLFQEQLRDSDSYLYLAAINGLASLSMYCTSEALTLLCREFLYVSNQQVKILTTENQNKVTEFRLKIGDIIVKVIKKLGETAVVHKAILLNTMLFACRDDDPLIRASALSNVAEIALVINYKMGTIIYEVLMCIWSVIETEKVIECRRAAVMVIASLIKGLGKETLIELKEKLLPIYRTINKLYKDTNEDTIVKLHAQLALEELNDIVKQFLLPELPLEKEFVLLSPKDDITFK